MTADEVATDIVDAAIKVHRALGPGLLESAYQACLAHERRRRQHRVECEVALSLLFEGVLIEWMTRQSFLGALGGLGV